mgnify:FL=1
MRISLRPLIIGALVIIAVLGMIICFELGAMAARPNDYEEQYGGESCNIAVIPLVGEITSSDAGTYSEGDFEDIEMVSADQVIKKLHDAEDDSSIKGVLIRIDSSGGGPTASEMITNTLKRLSIPTVALIREGGASGGYLVATGADTIIASVFSDVGSIGITMSYLENSKKNAKEGLQFVQLSSGKYKDTYNPDKPFTADERVLAERDLAIWKQAFVGQVAANRGMSVEQVEKLADGSTLPGELALQAGLVDSIGDQDSARTWFAKSLGVPEEEVVFCE